MFTQPNYRSKSQPPEYPRKAMRKRQQGTVLLRVLVGPQGRNLEVKLYKSSGYESLDEAAIEAVKGWQIEPAMIDGQRVSAWVEVPVTFSIK
ncbi:energy transducer TonB [Neptuniibacter sp. QD29_5]|uniref:energy transducer TonB n=1 Tax=unclassified Neptuniibacter TaxID=2630693 RepID=UPI0039F6A64B